MNFICHYNKSLKDFLILFFYKKMLERFFLLKNNICPSWSLWKRDVQWSKNNFLGPKDECPRFRQLLRQQGWRRRQLVYDVIGWNNWKWNDIDNTVTEMESSWSPARTVAAAAAAGGELQPEHQLHWGDPVQPRIQG